MSVRSGSQPGARIPKVYLAGKMDRDHDWRGSATSLCRYDRRGVSYGDWEEDSWNAWGSNGIKAELLGVPFIYVGPYPASCDHGCAHARSSLHMAETCSAMHQRHIVSASVGAILSADIVCCHISTADSYGTLVEIGVAAGREKPLSVTVDHDLAVSLARADRDNSEHQEIGRHDLWFAQEIARIVGGDAHTLPPAHSKEEGFEAARRFHSQFIAKLSGGRG